MNSSVIPWISHPGMGNSSMLMNPYDVIDPCDEELGTFFNHASMDTSTYFDHYNINPDPQPPISSPFILNLANRNPFQQNLHQGGNNPVVPQVFMPNNDEGREIETKLRKKRSRIRAPSQTYDHIMAERKRREQLSQLFVALSAVIPGLKRMDKSSILEDAIKYTKELKERVKNLEEKAEKHGMESVVVVKRTEMVIENEEYMSKEREEQPLPEIEVKVCNDHILIRLNCDNKKGVLADLICKVETLHMTILTTNAVHFRNVTLDVTIIAQMEEDFKLSAKEVVSAIRDVLQPSL